MSDTNGSTSTSEEVTPVAVPSTLVAIYQAWLQRGGKNPPPKEMERLKSVYKSAEAKRAKLAKELESAQSELYSAVRALAEAFGGQALKIDGIRHDFAARGDKVFFKVQGAAKNLIEI